MRRLKKSLKDRQGMSFPLVVAIVLVLLLILCGVMEYLRLNLIAAGVREAVQDAIVAVVNDNYANVYHGVREGYSGGYTSDGSGFAAAVDEGDVYHEVRWAHSSESSPQGHVKYAEGVVEYKITGLRVAIRNAPLAPSDPGNSQRFEADAMVKLEVPVRFAGKVLPPLDLRLKVQAGYIEVF